MRRGWGEEKMRRGGGGNWELGIGNGGKEWNGMEVCRIKRGKDGELFSRCY